MANNYGPLVRVLVIEAGDFLDLFISVTQDFQPRRCRMTAVWAQEADLSVALRPDLMHVFLNRTHGRPGE
jgi:hypothetical protein